MEENNVRKVYVLRTPKMLERYKKHLKENKRSIDFFFTNPAIKEWKYWRLINNDFPYDVLARRHHLLTPKRVFVTDMDMDAEERKELSDIKKELISEYDTVLENFSEQRSFKNHFHLHLINYKYEQG